MNAQAASISATPDLKIIDGQITTTSLQIAEHFGKRHTHVLRAIRNLLAELPENARPNFGLSEFTDGTGRKLPAYRITRDGFTLLAMGFTGKEAMQWKVAYLTAFNQMEAELLARTTRPANPAIDYDRISPAQAQDLKEIVAAIVQAGIQGYGETWSRLQRKFRVHSYLQLPAQHYGDARAYLLAKLSTRPATTRPAAGKMLVSRQHLASIYTDLGKLRDRIDAMAMPAQDLPPAWMQQYEIKA